MAPVLASRQGRDTESGPPRTGPTDTGSDTPGTGQTDTGLVNGEGED